MNNFERNAEACALSDARSGYSLAREVLELREKLQRAEDMLAAMRADKQLGVY